MGETVLQVHGVDDALNPVFVALLVAQQQRQTDVLFCGESWNKVERLEDEADLLATQFSEVLVAHLGEVCTIDDGAPLCQFVKTSNAMHEC